MKTHLTNNVLTGPVRGSPPPGSLSRSPSADSTPCHPSFILFMCFFMVIGCGDVNGRHASGGAMDGGGLAIVVKGIDASSPLLPDYARIATYRVTVSGEGIDEPIVAEFDGDADEGTIEHIPTGKNRRVEVTAANPRQQVIHAGETSDVEVSGGINAEVAVELQSVPIFVNLEEDARIDNTRIAFRVYTTPGDVLEIEDRSLDDEKSLVDAATSLPEVSADISTGVALLRPQLLTTGDHVFVARNVATGRQSQITLHLLDGTKRKAAPLFSAGLVLSHGKGRLQ